MNLDVSFYSNISLNFWVENKNENSFSSTLPHLTWEQFSKIWNKTTHFQEEKRLNTSETPTLGVKVQPLANRKHLRWIRKTELWKISRRICSGLLQQVTAALPRLSGFFPDLSSPWSLPEVAQIPNGFILQLRAKQRVGLGQDGYQPTVWRQRGRGGWSINGWSVQACSTQDQHLPSWPQAQTV